MVGVSADDVTSHKNFHHKFAFKIDLLSDTDAKLMKEVGDRAGGMEGNEVLGTDQLRGRSAGESSRKVYEKVNPEGHEKVLLDDIKGMQAKAA